MIVFRRKYPRWWFDWNLELLRFSNRVGVYLALMDDRYPSTDERSRSASTSPTPTRSATSTAGCRWSSGSWRSRTTSCWSSSGCWRFFCVVIAWFAILFTGRYPRGLFGFVEGVMRWGNRVVGLRLHPGHRPLPALQLQLSRTVGLEGARAQRPLEPNPPSARRAGDSSPASTGSAPANGRHDELRDAVARRIRRRGPDRCSGAARLTSPR